jgi:methionyl-tRNA formyltransferase
MARLVYLGTPDAAVEPLRRLVAAGHEVALVVTRADKRRGRGSALVPSPVKAAAAELGLNVTDDLGDVLTVDAELGVVVAYGRIIPVGVLDQLPMVNVHFSLLPRWRGAAPVERAILEGDAETGVCLMAVAAGLDTGGIYAEASTVIGPEETADDLRSRLIAMGSDLLVEHLSNGLAGLPVARDQNGTASYAEKILPGDFELHWDRPAIEVMRVVRLGRAWTTFRGRRLGVLRATEVAPAAGGGSSPGGGPADGMPRPGTRPGTLVDTVVATAGAGAIALLTVQPEGKRPMAAGDWRNGVRPAPGETLGAGDVAEPPPVG